MLEDGTASSGSVTWVIREGNTVRRPVRRWTLAVHALLRHLEKKEFKGVPQALGIDPEGREILSFIEGETAQRPWPEVLHSTDGLVQIAQFLARYHEAVRDFVPPPESEWYVPGVGWQAGQLIRHGDLGPWNSLWCEAKLVGVIDWDFAEPGHAMSDVAQVAWEFIPLRPNLWGRAGFQGRPDLQRRLYTLCDTYGAEPALVLEALIELQAQERERITFFGARGVEPWGFFLGRGDAEQICEEAAWLKCEFSSLIG